MKRLMLGSSLLLFWLVAMPLSEELHSASDVKLYFRYAGALLDDPRALPKEYPPLSALLFLLPRIVSGDSLIAYRIAFGLCAALAVGGLLLLVQRRAASPWLLLVLLLGSFGTLFFRYDVFVVLCTVYAFSMAAERRWVEAQLLSGLGVALKLYPLLLMPLWAAAELRSERRFPRASLAAGAATLAVCGSGMALAAPTQLSTMLAYHGQRPLEFESLPACIAWLFDRAPRAEFSFGSWNIVPAGLSFLPTLASVALVLSVLGACALHATGRVSLASAATLLLGAALLSSKVFSAQYLLWVLPFAVLALAERKAQVPRWGYELGAWLMAAWLTGVIFPIGFGRATSLLVGVVPTWLMQLVLLRNLALLGALLLLLSRFAGRRALESGATSPTSGA
jgi:hypothetical protein